MVTEVELYCFDHNSASPPGGTSAWYAPAVRVGRCLCDSGAAILRGPWWLRSSTLRSLRAEAQALPLPPPRSRRRPRDRLGEKRLSSALSSFFPAVPVLLRRRSGISLCPPPSSVGAGSAGTASSSSSSFRRRRRRLFLLLLSLPPFPHSPAPGR